MITQNHTFNYKSNIFVDYAGKKIKSGGPHAAPSRVFETTGLGSVFKAVVPWPYFLEVLLKLLQCHQTFIYKYTFPDSKILNKEVVNGIILFVISADHR